ncbi:exo-alpha-sialidase [Duganella sp. Leaf126]|uniref:exo-alpha-sialidase n=1 Tax=Duganella sp. Leaf126 TaxID=1736266 RepID=UPI0012E17D42|nr:exo-alpha-sialidase [Duganella sp. Leaf126]
MMTTARTKAAAMLVTAALAGTAGTATAYTWDSVAIGGGGFVSAVIPAKSERGVVYARTDVGGAYRWDNSKARWVALLDWVNEDQVGLQGVDALAVDPKNAARVTMLAGTSYFNDGKTAILRSTDYGKTFTVTDVSAQFKTHGNGMGRQNGERLVHDPSSSNVMYVGTRYNGLFKSTDYGATWARMTALNVTTTPNGVGISFVVPDPRSVANGVAQRLLVGVSRFGSAGPNLYLSTNAGASFAAVASSPAGLMPQRAVYDGAGNYFITYGNGAGPSGNGASEPMDQGQIARYSIAAGTLSNVTPAGVNRAFSGISVAANNPSRLVASTINTYLQQGDAWGDRIFVSSDGGATWTDVIARGFARDANGVSWIAGQAIHWAGSIAFDPFDSSAVWVSSGNGIFKTANIDLATTTWKFDVKGLEETVPRNMVSLTGGPLLSVISDYDGFRHTDPSQYAPIHTPRIGTTTGLAVAAANDWGVVRVGGDDTPAMYYSWDRGASWIKTSVNGKNGQVALSANAGVLLHSPENLATTYRSTNMGGSWTAVSGLNGAGLRPVADPVNASKFYVYANGTIMVSTDGGMSFAARATLPANSTGLIRAVPGREGDIWVPLRANGLRRSTDSGATFATIGTVSDCRAIGFGKAAANASYPTIFIWGTVGGVRGLFRSTDTGASWTRINDDSHQFGGPGNGEFVLGDMNTFGVVYMSTVGRGIVIGKP